MFKPDRSFSFSRPIALSLAAMSVIALSASPGAHAEGSKELNANGGNRMYGWQMERTQILAEIPIRTVTYAQASIGEKILVGSSAMGIGDGNAVITAPSGTTTSCVDDQPGLGVIADYVEEQAGPFPLASGFVPCVLVATETGAYQVEFFSTDDGDANGGTGLGVLIDADDVAWTQPSDTSAISAWDVTVTSALDAPIPGRVYLRYLPYTLSPNTAGAANAILYVLTRGGLQYEIDLNGQAAAQGIFWGSQKGLLDSAAQNALYASVTLDVGTNAAFAFPANVSIHSPNAVDDANNITQKIFLNPPAVDLPDTTTAPGGSDWLLAVYAETTSTLDASFEGTDTAAGVGQTFPVGGNFIINNDSPAGYVLDIDLGNGTNASLRGFLPTAGPSTVYWNGLDDQGDVVPNGTYAATVALSYIGGETHFPFLDVENNANGTIVQRLNGPSSPNFDLYYDDTAVGGSAAATTPEDSTTGAHVFSASFGAGLALDNWARVTHTAVNYSISITLNPSCGDGIENGDETDTDCGGDTCAVCTVGQACVDGDDCDSATCTADVCEAAPACDDAMQNGNETDTDCGGPDCDACGDGGDCSINSDCLSNNCDNSICIAAAGCGNSQVDTGETCDDGNTDAGDGCSPGCLLEYGYVCGTPGAACTPLDTDNDGRPDIVEDTNANGTADVGETDLTNPDTDGDGLCDGSATIAGTCSSGEDLNNDGVLDGNESDPLDPCDPSLNSPTCNTDDDGDGTPNAQDPAPNDPCIPSMTAGTCDRDDDGLTNDEEATLGTDPDDDDSDDDGIEDGAEDGTSDPLDPCDPDDAVANCDADQDGLTNGEEAIAQTDPNDADSDNDGLSDGAELNTYNTDPNDSDSDDGGVLDGAEVAAGTDPNDPDDDPISACVDVGVVVDAIGSLTVGNDKDIVITVDNVSTAATTDDLIVVNTLARGLLFKDAAGTSWVCSSVEQTVTCRYTQLLAGETSSPALTLTLGVGNAAIPQVTSVVTVHTDGDCNIGNNHSAPEVVSVSDADRDGDGIGDLSDNCVNSVNTAQDDTDGDGVGDACDPAPNTPGVLPDSTGDDPLGWGPDDGPECGCSQSARGPKTPTAGFALAIAFIGLCARRRRRA